MKRDIRTTLAVDGETKFKQEMQAAARELRVLQSEARANTAAFGDNAKSIDGLTQRNKDLAAVANQQRENIRALTQAVEDAAQKYGEADRRTDGYRVQLNNARTALAKTENEIRNNNKSIAELSDKWKQAGLAAEKAGKNISKAGKNISDAGSKLTRNVTVPLVAMGAAALKASIDFETAFTGVLKTVDGTEEQIAKLRQGIIDMSLVLPASTAEIAGVAEAAGQLGIQTDNILAFTRTMIDLGETTNLSAAEGASALAQFANVTQMSQGNFDRLGSTIVALGNNLETTEADIVNMSMGLAGAGKQIGLTEAQIMGFSGALASVGIRAEAGGSAFSKVFSNMQVAVETSNSKLRDFARVAGMTSAEFQQAFKRDAAGAIASFIEGLSKMDEKGISSIATLEEMGITELRLRDSLLRVSNAGDLVRSSLDLATKSWGENIALTREAELRYGTTASQAKILYNETKEVARQFGDAMVPALREVIGQVKPLIRGFAELSTEKKLSIIRAAAFVAAIGPVTKVLGGTTKAIGDTVDGFSKLSKAISSAGGIASAISGPAGWAVLGAVALGGMALAISKLVKEHQELTKEARELDKAMSDAVNSFDKAQDTFQDTSDKTLAAAELAEGYIDRLEELERTGLDAAESQREYASIIQRLNELIPELNITIDQQTGLVQGGTSALKDNTQAWKENAIAQALQQQVTEQVKMHTDALVELTKKRQEHARMEAKFTELRREQLKLLDKMETMQAGSTEWMDANNRARELGLELTKLDGIMGRLGSSIQNGETTVTALAEELNITEAAARELMDALAPDPVDVATGAIEGLTAAEEEAARKALEMARAQEKAAGITQDAFSRVEGKAKLSVKEMIKNLEFNQKAVREWSENLAILAERGVDEGLLKQLRDAGPEMRLTVASMVKASDEELAKLSEVFRAGAQTAVDSAKSIGSNIGDSFADGIEESAPKVEKAAKRVAAIAETAMKAELQIASPSRKFKGFGVNAYESFATALEDGKGRVGRAVGVLANSLTMPSFGAPAFPGAGGGATTIQVTNNFHVTGSVSQNELNKVADYANQGLSKALQKRRLGSAVL